MPASLCQTRSCLYFLTWSSSAHIDIYLMVIKRDFAGLPWKLVFIFLQLHFYAMAVKPKLCLSVSSLLAVSCQLLFPWCIIMYSIQVMCDKAWNSVCVVIIPFSKVVISSCIIPSLILYLYSTSLLDVEHHCRARDPKYFMCSPGPRGLVHICLHHQGPADQPPLLPCVQHSRCGKVYFDIRTI